MPKFRKKPVEIEAWQVPPEGADCPGEMVAFLKDAEDSIICEPDGSLTICTLEGDMNAAPMDWIIKGVNGEFYPCKPDIFDKTYEPVS